jgi:hypothetical protein
VCSDAVGGGVDVDVDAEEEEAAVDDAAERRDDDAGVGGVVNDCDNNSCSVDTQSSSSPLLACDGDA